MTGQTVLSGEALAHVDEQGDDVLVIVGQLVITSPVQHVGSKQLIVIGQVLAPTGSETALGAALTRLTGQLSYYPYTEGARMRVVTGTVRLSAAELANPAGQPTDMLLCVGQLVITGNPRTIGYDNVVVVGHIVAPQGSEEVIAGRLVSLSSETVFYSAAPRVFVGKDTFSGAFFELLDEPMTLVLDGKFVFDDDVSPDLLKQKVSAIVLHGKITAPKPLVPMLQLLTIARDGPISSTNATD
jgi:hypothetical protein